MNVYAELEEIRKRRFKDINKWKCKGVTRKYAFELPIPHGEHRFMKIKYPASMPPMPQNLTGNTFECIFGSGQSMLELFLIKRKIKGPCWLTIKNFKKNTEYRRSWAKHEIVMENPKDVEVTIDDLNKASPPLVSLTFSMKTVRNQHNTNEIAMISCIV
jgi:DNA polymerase alpha subunit A